MHFDIFLDINIYKNINISMKIIKIIRSNNHDIEYG